MPSIHCLCWLLAAALSVAIAACGGNCSQSATSNAESSPKSLRMEGAPISASADPGVSPVKSRAVVAVRSAASVALGPLESAKAAAAPERLGVQQVGVARDVARTATPEA